MSHYVGDEEMGKLKATHGMERPIGGSRSIVLLMADLERARELLRMIQRGEWDDTAIDTYLEETE